MTSYNTPYATLAFPALFKPRPQFEGADKLVYQATLIFSPAYQKTEAFKAMQDAVARAVKEGAGDKASAASLTLPFKDAGEKAGQWNGFEPGHVYIKTWSTSKPEVVDRNLNDILTPEEVWAGQLVRANVTPGFWQNSGKKGVSFYLNHIQVVKTDLPRIDGKASAKHAFDDGEVTADEDIFG